MVGTIDPNSINYYYDLATPTNIGPLTTTFEAPATCTGIDVAGTGHEAFFEQNYFINTARCNTTLFNDCIPSPTGGVALLEKWPESYATYHSPGLICPKGWATAKSYASATSSEQPIFATGRPDEEFYLDQYPLEEAETLVLCCPEKFGHAYGMCVGPKASRTAEEHIGYCTETYDHEAYASSYKAWYSSDLPGPRPTTSYYTTTVAIPPEEGDMRAMVSPIVMVHKAADMSEHSVAVPAGTPAECAAQATSNPGEKSKDDPKKGAASGMQMSTVLMSAAALVAAGFTFAC